MSVEMSKYLQELAKKQEELKVKIKKDHWRLAYHLMPTTGWMNDPNGLCQLNGTYHFYHQYGPASATGEDVIHWGHKTSKDLVHFQDEEIFLYPNHSYDRDGVYSGSALVKDGKIHFFYTGNVKLEGDHDYTFSGREQNTVHVVSEDGFKINSQKVVIPHATYPKEFTNHIRDPKVFKKNGVYWMLLGARTRDNEGKIPLFKSNDLDDWSYQGNFFGDDFSLGFMWECPDFFEVDNQEVLVFSPQGVNGSDFEFQNVYQSGYMLGNVDWQQAKFKQSGKFIEFDRGFDFYAPQTFEDEQGRRILIAWMGIGDTMPEYSYPTANKGWQHAATLPREITVTKGKLYQKPLKEYEVLRCREEKYHYEKSLKNEQFLKGEVYEMCIEILEQGNFAIKMREDTVLQYNNGVLTLQHGPSGFGRNKRQIELKELEKIQLFMDKSSIEIFINDGEYVMTSRFFPKNGCDFIEFTGDAHLLIKKWNLNKAISTKD